MAVHKIKQKIRYYLVALFLLITLVAAAIYLSRVNIPLLETKGLIANKEAHLIEFATLLSLVVVIPVFVLLFSFAYKYREGNKTAQYDPKLSGSRTLETLWWIIPSIIILILSIVTWDSSHALDPYKPLSSKNKAVVIDVIALDWKWLFIYPDQNIASINQIDIPINTPISFNITSDAPMNSFWVPALSGQIYAMPGMSTQLNLEANKVGSYDGLSANISGNGFAGMRFKVLATSYTKYVDWVNNAKKSPNKLSFSTYNVLLKPSENSPVFYYSGVAKNLYYNEVSKYMSPVLSQKYGGSS